MSSHGQSDLSAPLINSTSDSDEGSIDSNFEDEDLRNTAIADADLIADIPEAEEPSRGGGWCFCLGSTTEVENPNGEPGATYVKNDLFVEVAEVMAKPMAADKNTRTITVRLETIGEYQLFFSLVFLIGSIIGPLAVLRAKQQV